MAGTTTDEQVACEVGFSEGVMAATNDDALRSAMHHMQNISYEYGGVNRETGEPHDSIGHLLRLAKAEGRGDLVHIIQDADGPFDEMAFTCNLPNHTIRDNGQSR